MNQTKPKEASTQQQVVCPKLQKYTSQQWLEEIENRYFDERDDLVRQSFQAALDDVQEPYSFILHIVLKAFFDLYRRGFPLRFMIWMNLIYGSS